MQSVNRSHGNGSERSNYFHHARTPCVVWTPFKNPDFREFVVDNWNKLRSSIDRTADRITVSN